MKQALATKGKGTFILAVMLLVLALSFSTAGAANSYLQTNLVSDISGLAKFTDPSLINPWGISHSPTSPNWVSVNGSGLANIYNGAGVKQGLVVTIPPVGAGNPTGQVFNGNGMLLLMVIFSSLLPRMVPSRVGEGRWAPLPKSCNYPRRLMFIKGWP